MLIHVFLVEHIMMIYRFSNKFVLNYLFSFLFGFGFDFFGYRKLNPFKPGSVISVCFVERLSLFGLTTIYCSEPF